MPTLTEIKGYYYIKYYDTNKHYTRTKTTSLKTTPGNRSAANKILKEFTINLHSGKLLKDFGIKPTSQITLQAALDEYLQLKRFKPNTNQLYNLAVNHLKKVITSEAVASITVKDYTKLLNRFDNKILAQNSQSIYTRHLKALWKYFVEKGYASENIITRIKSTHKIPQPIPPKDLEKILNELNSKENKQQYHLIKFLLLTGVRISTALALNWRDVRLKDGFIYFKNVKMEGKEFPFPITRDLKKLLREMGPKLGGRVFIYKSKNSLRFWSRAQDDLKLKNKYGLHQLRKTFTSIMVNNNISLDDLSELTNTDPRTLKKYYAKRDLMRIKRKVEAVKL